MRVKTKSGYYCAAAWETCVETGKDDVNIVRNTEFVSSTILGSLMYHGKEGEKILSMKLSVGLLVQNFLCNRKVGTTNRPLFPVTSLQMPYIL